MDSPDDAYLGGVDDAPYAAFDETRLPELPPTLVVVSEYDDLRPPAEDILDRMQAVGARMDKYLARGVPHGHLNVTPLVPETRATLERMAAYLRM